MYNALSMIIVARYFLDQSVQKMCTFVGEGKEKGKGKGGSTLLIKVHFPKVKNAYITHKMRISGIAVHDQ